MEGDIVLPPASAIFSVCLSTFRFPNNPTASSITSSHHCIQVRNNREREKCFPFIERSVFPRSFPGNFSFMVITYKLSVLAQPSSRWGWVCGRYPKEKWSYTQKKGIAPSPALALIIRILLTNKKRKLLSSRQLMVSAAESHQQLSFSGSPPLSPTSC